MPVIQHNPKEVFPPYTNYSHAVEITAGSRMLIISGLNGYPADGSPMPEPFEKQGELIWQHIGTLLRSAGMDYKNLISVRTYLAHPMYDEANMKLRAKFLGEHKPALTVVCCQLLESNWKLEVEAMAAV